MLEKKKGKKIENSERRENIRKLISDYGIETLSDIKDAINDMINKKLPNIQINRSYKIKSNWFDRATNSTKLWRGILDLMKEGK